MHKALPPCLFGPHTERGVGLGLAREGRLLLASVVGLGLAREGGLLLARGVGLGLAREGGLM